LRARLLAHFAAFTYDTLVASGRTIDVPWLNERGLPNAFFEVENTTNMKNSLLKFQFLGCVPHRRPLRAPGGDLSEPRPGRSVR
jgi:hypothetical protein